MKKGILGIFFVTSLGTAVASDTMECRAKVALNRVYDVSLDLGTRHAKISTDNGYRHEGTATYSFSPRTGNGYYFLPTSFSTGIELEVEAAGSQRVALCLAANECYLCRRK